VGRRAGKTARRWTGSSRTRLGDGSIWGGGHRRGSLGRSLPDLLSILGDLHAAGIDLFVRREGLDTSSPTSRAAFGLMGLFAEFERNLTRERVLAGLARARAEGRVLSRPRLAEEKSQAFRRALAAGNASLREIAARCRVGVGTVQRMKTAIGGA